MITCNVFESLGLDVLVRTWIFFLNSTRGMDYVIYPLCVAFCM